MAQKIIYWLLITLILSLGFGQLLRFDFYGLPLYLHDILVVLVVILSVLNLAKTRVSDIVLPRGISLFVFALGVSSIRALTLYPISSLVTPSLYLFRLVAYIFLYMLIKYQKIKVPTSIFVVAGIVTIVIGFTQYVLVPDMRIFQYAGWDDHLSRLTLPHFDPSFTGIMIGLFALSMFSVTTVVAVPIIIFSIISILLTYARSVWLSLLLLGFIFIKNKAILFVLVVSIFIAVFLLPQKFGEGTNLLRTYSISSRAGTDYDYLQQYNWEVIFGRGMNTLILDLAPSDITNHATGPNNSYLYLLLTSGVLGLIGWGMFMWDLYQKSTYKYTLIFFFLASLFNNVMFYPFALLWVLLLEAKVPT